jgi:uncharacterized Zn finger protein (UPF0148 family)
MLSVKALHDKQMKQFLNDEQLLPKKEKRLKQLLNKELKMDMFDSNLYTVEKEILSLKREIQDIKSKNNQTKYLTNVMPVLYKQARNVEKEDQPDNQVKVGIMKFIEPGSLGAAKIDLLSEYIEATDKIPSTPTKQFAVIDDTCKKCFSKMCIIKKESSMSCPSCGNSFWFFDTDAPQWSDSVEINTQFAYERISHFKEHLNQFQGKEVKTIPEELINDILMEMGKIRIHPSILTKKTLKIILKKLKKSSYFNNINSIIYKISSVKPPQLSLQLEERLIALFKVIQQPFETYKPKDRKNFFSYPYVIHKLLEIIAIKEPEVLQYIKHFPLLKSRDKILSQDITWKLVCESLGWKYTCSI